MALNKQSGNMYRFVTHTWNVIKGKCPHDCSYCYMKRFPQGELHFDDKELKTDLGDGNFIFVGSSCDMFAEAVPREWIIEVLDHCGKYNNTYLFQTKNPERFIKLREELEKLRPNVILGTTMETNRSEILAFHGEAPPINQRSDAMTIKGFRKMITIEPIMDFDVIHFIREIRRTQPEWVNIGADSQGHGLPEPSWFKIMNLKEGLEKFTDVKLKDNLGRLKKDA